MHKVFINVQHTAIIKATKLLRIEGTYLNILRVICDKPIGNIILSGGEIERISSKAYKTRTPTLSSPVLFNIILEVLARAIR